MQDARDAVLNMKITAQDLVSMGVVDGVITEPFGGAHRFARDVIMATGDQIQKSLGQFDDMSESDIREHRREKFLKMGSALS